MFLLIVFTLCGAATILFTLGSVRPALRAGGWSATVGSVLLALSAAAAIAALAVGILRRSRDMGVPETGHLAETAKL